MTPSKKNSGKGILPKLKTFLEALGDRYHRALHVIDEALASDNLKDKIWAVDLILKRTPPLDTDGKAKTDAKQSKEALSSESLNQMNTTELMDRIRTYLKEPGP